MKNKKYKFLPEDKVKTFSFKQAVKFIAKNKNSCLFFDKGWSDSPVKDWNKVWSFIEVNVSEKDGHIFGFSGDHKYGYVTPATARLLRDYGFVKNNTYGGYKARALHEGDQERTKDLIAAGFKPLRSDLRFLSPITKKVIMKSKDSLIKFESALKEIGYNFWYYKYKPPGQGIYSTTLVYSKGKKVFKQHGYNCMTAQNSLAGLTNQVNQLKEALE